MVDASIESQLDNVFNEAAQEKGQRLKGKNYNYTYKNGVFFDQIVSTGICRILAIKYSRKFDCDIISIQDINSGMIYNCIEFGLNLKEVDINISEKYNYS